MKLNPDCVRDILMDIEESLEFKNVYFVRKETSAPDEPITLNKTKYPHNVFLYHVSQCEQSNFITKVSYLDSGNCVQIGNMTPKGHDFLANIRADNIWNKVKSVGMKIGATSLSALVQISTGVVTQIIKNELML